MDIYQVLINIFAEVLALANGALTQWVNVTGNVTGPLDPDVTFSSSGTAMVSSMASVVIETSKVIAAFFEILF